MIFNQEINWAGMRRSGYKGRSQSATITKVKGCSEVEVGVERIQLVLLYPENGTAFLTLNILFQPHCGAWGGEISIQLCRIDPDCQSPSLPVSVKLHPDWTMKIDSVPLFVLDQISPGCGELQQLLPRLYSTLLILENGQLI